MFDLFNLFGRADNLKAVDQALRDVGIHPKTVPEAVKLATVRLLQKSLGKDVKLPRAAVDNAAELLSYCILGPDQYLASNTPKAAEHAEDRLDAAIAAGDGPDAELILLALHSGIISADVADRFDIETG